MIDNQINLIEAEVDAARHHLSEIEVACDALKQAGMFDSLPHFQFQARGDSDEKRYLYLVYRQNADGSYAGPNGQRKVYIGADLDKIAEQRRLERNTLTYQTLKSKALELRRWIEARKKDLQELERHVTRLVESAKRWPCTPIPAPEMKPAYRGGGEMSQDFNFERDDQGEAGNLQLESCWKCGGQVRCYHRLPGKQCSGNICEKCGHVYIGMDFHHNRPKEPASPSLNGFDAINKALAGAAVVSMGAQ